MMIGIGFLVDMLVLSFMLGLHMKKLCIFFGLLEAEE